MEAPKYEQLLKVVEVRNPNWYPFIHGYLKGELENLELDNDFLELGQQRLDIGNNEFCVVAEPFGFKKQYSHDEYNDCFMCGEYAMRLYNNSGVYEPQSDFPDSEDGTPDLETQREIFANTLENFYRHRGFMK